MAYEKKTQRYTPTAGATVSILKNQCPIIYCIIDPSGNLASLTIKLIDYPEEADVVVITYTKAVTSLSTQVGLGGATISQTPTSASANQSHTYIYNDTINKWYRAS